MRFTVQLLILLFFSMAGAAQAPFRFSPITDIPATGESGALDLAWAGGLNAGQYSTMDLNEDGRQDLVIFDRTTNKINTFLNTGSEYRYAPRYEYFFPDDIHSWMLLADYNCDGRKDIFANTTFGLKIYRNTTENELSFQLEVDPLTSESESTEVNLQVNASDLPAISDVDGDGDLDILVFNFAIGGTVEYHQNQSMEMDGTCNHLRFTKITGAWGDFVDCDCGVYAFNKSCDETGGRTLHAGGKSLLTFDQDGDGDHDLLFGDEFCTHTTFMVNQGSSDQALFTAAQTDFPDDADPIDFFIFPGVFYEDLDFDGRMDLVAAPNVFDNAGRQVDFQHSSYFYPNQGVEGAERFSFHSNDFLQSRMIEVGEMAVPLFFDFDGDGDQDLLVGNEGNLVEGVFRGTFTIFDNVGSFDSPMFQLTSDDFLGLSGMELRALKPSMGDINNDGKLDLVFAAAAPNGQTSIYYFFNTNNRGFQPASSQPSILPFTIQSGDHPHLTDLDGDGKVDILLGKRTGRLEFWQNVGFDDTFDFELVNEEVAGISDDSFRRQLVPLVADLNNDEELELITIDASGTMRIYTHFLSDGENPPLEMFEYLVSIEPAIDLLRSRWGRGATLASAALTTGLPYLVVGSAQGGLFVLENFSMDGSVHNEVPFQLKTFPNPGQEIVRITGNKRFSYQLLNSLGQLLIDQPGFDVEFRLDTRTLRDGMYLVRAASIEGAVQTKKLMIIH